MTNVIQYRRPERQRGLRYSASPRGDPLRAIAGYDGFSCYCATALEAESACSGQTSNLAGATSLFLSDNGISFWDLATVNGFGGEKEIGYGEPGG